ncbi:prenyltransferase/squalene oxidase repeat-containing protein [Blastopirellula marina]|uniref:prenyltransferase/squalene oxidase repeat-containing protein n=1 Tax=Blastopirellula marina TaxID=124 RepID=UPI000D1E4C3F|nr:prenyltransferase/squalene oxidase repeat-containing protein [Blastopirellula marina]PTL42339.1 squalene--hopene cyclase [Blastopirellula marina]
MTAANLRTPLAALLLTLTAASVCVAQSPELRFGETVPRDVREMYDRGLRYLSETQAEDGGWEGGQQGPGVDGLCVIAFLASGEDPNFGIYSNQIRKGLRKIIGTQDPTTGYMGNSMYHHGFAMLALAEAYGAVDDRNLWPPGDASTQRSIGEALELAVRLAITSQKKNSLGAWRYSPEAQDADTSVSGSILVGLLAARNSGVEVPDEAIDRAIGYFKSMTANNGQVAYAGGLGGLNESIARISIATLVYSIARRQDLTQYAAAKTYLVDNMDTTGGHYKEYTLYYEAQALFQGDGEAWEKWNKQLIRKLKTEQQENGSFDGSYGKPLATSMSLLALALNYRFLPIYER